MGLMGPTSLSGQSADTARVYFQSVGLDKQAAGIFAVNIYVDSAVEVNAYEIDFKFPEEFLTYIRANTAKSIINVMPEGIFADSTGRVYIRGGSTKAFSGQGGLLASLYFKPIKTGSGTIGFVSATLHVADGKGTALTPVAYQSDLSITGLASVSENLINIPSGDGSDEGTDQGLVSFDNLAPKITLLRLEKNPFDEAEWLLIFDATDAESGVSHYLAREKQWFIYGEYRRAESNVYSVTPGAWAVELTAVDNFGNEASQTIYRFGSLGVKVGFLVLLLLGLWFLRWAFKSYRMHRVYVGNRSDN